MPTYSPNLLLVPTRDATVINAAIWRRVTHWEVNWAEIPCVDGVGGDHILISAGMFGRHFVPEPFASASGIQNPVVWGTFLFGPGYLDQDYREEWFIENVTQPVVFTLEGGQLPPGLILSTVGNTARGRISGTPIQVGTYGFVLRATGPDLTGLKNFSIVIHDVPKGGTAYVGGN